MKFFIILGLILALIGCDNGNTLPPETAVKGVSVVVTCGDGSRSFAGIITPSTGNQSFTQTYHSTGQLRRYFRLHNVNGDFIYLLGQDCTISVIDRHVFK